MEHKPNSPSIGTTLVAGTFSGIVVTVATLAFATLIFSGPLAIHLSKGIGYALASAALLAIVASLFSAGSGLIVVPQAKSAAILSVTAISLAEMMPANASPETTFATIIGALAITTLLTGLISIALASFQLGDLIRSVPYPVVGAFFVGTGWLLIDGAFALSTGTYLYINRIEDLFTASTLAIWAPAFTLALLTIINFRATDKLSTVPILLIGSIGIFYGLLFLLDISVADAQKAGWLAKPLADIILPDPTYYSNIHIFALGDQLLKIAAIILISIIALVFQTSSIELATGQDLDVHRELKTVGLANAVSSLAGGIVGYHSTHLSLLTHRLDANNRQAGLITGVVCLIALFFSHYLIAYIPVFLFNGLLFFFGLNILIEWLSDVRHRLTRIEFGLILFILATVIVFGFMPGIGLGILSGIVLLLINHGKINAAKHELTGSALRSNVERGETQQQLLREQGDKIYIARLQGFIYFSTANKLLQNIQQRITTARAPIHSVILDFKDVEGLDSTALIPFAKIRQFAAAQNAVLIFVSLSNALATQFEESAFDLEDTDHFSEFENIDEGLAWSEDQILETAQLPEEPFEELLARYLPASVSPDTLLKYMERQYLGPNIPLIQQNDPADDIFFVEKGQVSIQMELEDNNIVRIKTLGSGTIVGEVAMYLGFTRTASVVTTQPTTVFKLSRESMEQMERDEPAIATAFHKLMASMLCVRLSDTNKIVQALLE